MCILSCFVCRVLQTQGTGLPWLTPSALQLTIAWGWRAGHHRAVQMSGYVLPCIREMCVWKGCFEGGSLEFLVIAHVSASYFRKERP